VCVPSQAVDGHGVEQFVREDDSSNRSGTGVLKIRHPLDVVEFGAQFFLLTGTPERRRLNDEVAQTREKGGAEATVRVAAASSEKRASWRAEAAAAAEAASSRTAVSAAVEATRAAVSSPTALAARSVNSVVSAAICASASSARVRASAAAWVAAAAAAEDRALQHLLQVLADLDRARFGAAGIFPCHGWRILHGGTRVGCRFAIRSLRPLYSDGSERPIQLSFKLFNRN